MLPSRFVKRLLIVIFVIQTAAQRTTVQQIPQLMRQAQQQQQRIHDDFQPIRMPPTPPLLFPPLFMHKSDMTNDEAGNGMALPVLDNPEHPMVYTENGQNPVNWFSIWQRMRKPRQKSNFQNQNVALPFARNVFKFKFQTNGIDDNSYPRVTGNGYDDPEDFGVNYAGDDVDDVKKEADWAGDTKATTENMQNPPEKQKNDKDVADRYKMLLQAGREVKRHSKLWEDQQKRGWHGYDASDYKGMYDIEEQQDFSPHDTVKRMHWRSYKREKSRPERTTFLPSISAGAMTNLGDFFRDLTKNVRFTEKSQLGQEELKLLDGNHPLRMLHEEWANSGGGGGTGEEKTTDASAKKTAEFLNAIVKYRPSQKIRSLVSMNPRGYHGTQFLDPNYMWVGLGK